MIEHDISDNAKAKQRVAILKALRAGPVSTIDARESYGVFHPAGRVRELRKAGHRIKTEIRTVLDAQGRPHRCGVYVLTGGAP